MYADSSSVTSSLVENPVSYRDGGYATSGYTRSVGFRAVLYIK